MLSTGLAALKESDDRTTPDCGPASVRLLCERRAERLETGARVVEGCGAKLYDAGSFAPFEEGKSHAGGIVLVALEECPEANTPLLRQIGALRRARLVVVCYGDGVRLWPLGRRCQLLLAGALDILDSGRAEFPRGLARPLTRLRGAEAH